jgi:hypothetical protein
LIYKDRIGWQKTYQNYALTGEKSNDSIFKQKYSFSSAGHQTRYFEWELFRVVPTYMIFGMVFESAFARILFPPLLASPGAFPFAARQSHKSLILAAGAILAGIPLKNHKHSTSKKGQPLPKANKNFQKCCRKSPNLTSTRRSFRRRPPPVQGGPVDSQN